MPTNATIAIPLAGLLLVGVLGLVGSVDAASPAMTDEDVVRLVVQGTPIDRILQEIAERPPAFDLSAEMLEELEVAGVPRQILDAMIARQRETEAPEAEPVVEPGPTGAVARIRIAMPDDEPVIRMAPTISEITAARWQLPQTFEERRAGSLALFVSCMRPEHVPDHWRSKSPLGRDFSATPRHRMLEFLSTESTDDKKGKLVLEVPEWIDVELDSGTEHDLRIGLALQVEDRYYTLIADRWIGLEFADHPRELGVRLGKRLSNCPKTPGTLWGIRWDNDD